MRCKSFFLVCAIYALPLACVTTAKYEAMLETWKGQSTGDLIMYWGAPDRTFTAPNGMTVYEYVLDGATTIANGQRVTTRVKSRWCKTSFFIKDDTVIRWQWEGDVCRSK